MKILICNVGSTSFKAKLYQMPEETVLAVCSIERVGSRDDSIFHYENRVSGEKLHTNQCAIPDIRSGLLLFLEALTDDTAGAVKEIKEIERVGFKAPCSKGYSGVFELTDEVLGGMEAWIPIAPLHNPAYITAIRQMREVLPDVPFIASFETGFHRTIPLERRIYGVPYEWYEKYQVARLGYHGASHSYIASVLSERFGAQYKAVSCHLGGSSSVCGIKDGQSVDTSFGMTLQTGLIHAARTGDLDCDLTDYLKSAGLSEEEIHKGIVGNGGLLGISGVSSDLRYVEEAADAGNERAKLAIDAFVSGIVHYIGAFAVDMEGLDVIVFTAGIGEHSARTRQEVCRRLSLFGVCLDEKANANVPEDGVISTESSKVKVLVIPTDEEKGIARSTYLYR